MKRDIDQLVDYFDNTVRKNIEKKIRDEADKKGLDADQLLAERTGGSVKITVLLEFPDKESA
jgi:hypothetical protein